MNEQRQTKTASAERHAVQRRHLGPVLLIALVATLLMYPWIVWGVPPGHDQDTHLQYFHAFNEQFRAGELYPRWLSSLNFGAGSPVFFAQYPLPYFAGAVLHRALHLPATPAGESHALGLVFVLAAISLGIALYFWCSRFVSRRNAILAAIAGLTLPYVLWFDFYTRIGVGECLALISLPLALYFCGDIEANPARAIAGTSIAFGLLLVSNLLFVISFGPFYLFYLISITPKGKYIRALFVSGIGALLGAGLAGIYLLPLIANKKFFNFETFAHQLGGIYLYDNELFPINTVVAGSFPSGWWLINWLIRLMALFAIGLTAFYFRDLAKLPLAHRILAGLALAIIVFTAIAPFVFHPAAPGTQLALPVLMERNEIFGFAFLSMELYFCLALVFGILKDQMGFFYLTCCLLSFLATTRWTALFWRHAHFLWNMQFPWRFLAYFSIFSVGLIALALERIQSRVTHQRRGAIVLALLLIPISLLSIFAWQVPGKALHHEPDRPARYVDVALPTYVHSSESFGDFNLWPGSSAKIGDLVVQGSGTVSERQIKPRRRIVNAICDGDCLLQMNLTFYPKWTAHTTSGEAVPLSPDPSSGLAQMRLPGGAHEIIVEIPADRFEYLGAILSGLCMLMLILIIFVAVRHRAGAGYNFASSERS